MKKFTFPLFIFLLFTFAGNIYSQEVLNLRDAINKALKNSPTVSNLEGSVEIQKLNTNTAVGNLFPDLNLSANWNRNNTFSEGTVRFENGVPIIIPKQDTWINSFGIGVNSNITLFDGFSNYAQVDLQEENEKSVKINLDKEKYDIAFRVNSAYFNVLKREKIIIINEENLTDSRSQLESVKEFMNVGKRTIADVYRQDVQVAQNELALERALNEFDKSQIDLLLAMNSDFTESYKISDPNIVGELTESELQSIMSKYTDLGTLTKRSLSNRYDYKSTLQQIQVSKTQFSIDQKNLYFPTIIGGISYNLNAANIGGLLDTRSFSFGLSLSYPIFQGNSIKNRSQISEIAIKQNEDNLRIIEKQIQGEVRKAYIDLETQYKQIEILKRNITSAEQDKLLSEESYRVGTGILLDVQTATIRLNNLRIDLINSYYDFLLSEKNLQYFLGELRY
ncbi:MAG TPA: TolC family protein [Ignavibacteria bacterium]|nr:TolC family protein [Ignavibacteria bacterium]HQY52347.1 TolC family protein [Ignavibacteria bacterium]HRB00485.1 TolC family protein [Ignavibacteria bacterium]